jgi:hypothetical protein
MEATELGPDMQSKDPNLPQFPLCYLSLGIGRFKNGFLWPVTA